MRTTAVLHRYRAFGLAVHSGLELSELQPAPDGADEAPDVLIRVADLTRAWSELPDQSHLQVRGGEVFYYIPGAAIYRIRGGREIAVSPFAGADPGLVRLYLLGSCMGALLLQRRMLPLHGSALDAGGKAFAIVGPSGAGKSTLAAALAARGCRLLSDDISPVRFRPEDGAPLAVPSYPQQKLWRDSLQRLGVDASGARSIYAESDKFAVPVSAEFGDRPVPIGDIFEIVPSPENVPPAAEPVEGLNKLPVVAAHTYRNYLIPALQLQEWHFSAAARLCGKVRVHRLVRPAGRFTAEELASLVLGMVRKGA